MCSEQRGDVRIEARLSAALKWLWLEGVTSTGKDANALPPGWRALSERLQSRKLGSLDTSVSKSASQGFRDPSTV
jgi:hypothetical protein